MKVILDVTKVYNEPFSNEQQAKPEDTGTTNNYHVAQCVNSHIETFKYKHTHFLITQKRTQK